MKLAPTRIRSLARTYGLTPTQFQTLIADGCPLCRKPYSSTRTPVVDHAHGGSDPGLIRGAPCAPCNYRLGLLFDDAQWLQRAADYLADPPAPHLIGTHYIPGSPPPTAVNSGQPPGDPPVTST